jgi:hypothetical protein
MNGAPVRAASRDVGNKQTRSCIVGCMLRRVADIGSGRQGSADIGILRRKPSSQGLRKFPARVKARVHILVHARKITYCALDNTLRHSPAQPSTDTDTSKNGKKSGSKNGLPRKRGEHLRYSSGARAGYQ